MREKKGEKKLLKSAPKSTEVVLNGLFYQDPQGCIVPLLVAHINKNVPSHCVHGFGVTLAETS